MRRFLWIALIFGGGIAALMVASIVLQQQADKKGAGSSEDLHTLVANVRQALTDWDYDKLRLHTSDIPKRVFQQMFDDANGGDLDRVRKFKGVLSAMDVFPSIRFPNIRPTRVDVSYEVEDGPAAAKPVTSFVARDDGFFLRTVRFPVSSADEGPTGEITFHEGDNISFVNLLEKLSDVLTAGKLEDFRSLMAVDHTMVDGEARQLLDDMRAQVMACRTNRLKKMLPLMGSLPRGTKWLRLLVIGEVEEKRLWIEMEVVPGTSARLRKFRAGVIKKRARTKKPAENPPAP